MGDYNIRRKILLATFCSVLFFAIWDTFVLRPLKKQQEILKGIEQNIEIKSRKLKKAEAKLTDNVDKKAIVENVIDERVIKIDNEYIGGTISTKGLKLNNIFLKKYKKDLNSNEFVKLLSDTYFVEFGWLSNENIILPDENTVWEADCEVLTNNQPITFTYRTGDITFKIILSLDDKYMFDIEQVIENNTQNHIYVQNFGQIQKKYIVNKKAMLEKFLVSGVFNKKFEELKIKKIEKKNFEYNKFNWFGFGDTYWTTNIISNNNEDLKANFFKIEDTVKAQFISNKEFDVKPNSSFSLKNRLFVGAKDLSILDDYSTKLNIPLFDRTVDFGLLYILTKPMYLILSFFYKLVGNLGIAILILTIIVKMLLYPSTKKSYISMAKMKKIQPEMLRIQNQYKDDKVLLSQKISKLYKDNGVNPLSGCLPMLLQLPIFFALYKVFIVAIEMRQAPFFGYIKDLSVADSTSLFNLFGLLPYNAPKLGFLPCIMALTMWTQQKINEKQSAIDKNNPMNSSMKYMPWIFLVMFANFPSGLLLYWIFSNIITILQQIWINKKINKLSTKI